MCTSTEDIRLLQPFSQSVYSLKCQTTVKAMEGDGTLHTSFPYTSMVALKSASVLSVISMKVHVRNRPHQRLQACKHLRLVYRHP